MILADLGAEVLRVEAPHRPDLVRSMPPLKNGVSARHALLNRSKRSMTLDLKKPGAVEIVKDLVQSYDIVLEQFRPGVMNRLGVGYEALSHINPGLIYCAITGYGQTGPYKDRAGHDNNYLALAGVMSHTGRREDGPLPFGIQVADVGGGSFTAVTGLLAAVIHRHHTGEGQFVDISMFDGAIAWHAPSVSDYLVGEQVADYETHLLNGGSYYDFYRTADGRYLSVGSLEPKFWQGFCEAIGRPDLIEAGLDGHNLAKQQEVKVEIEKVIATRTFEVWQEIFAQVDVCVEPVLTIPEMTRHPHTAARQMIVPVPQPDGAPQPQVGSPIKFSKTPATYKHIGPALGQHTQEVLAELEYDEAKIEQLQTAGVFG
jgi:crotonobetainyl-CoA:carnitine CoA-transferase CaiB-like acyl-CoA transferase